MADDRDRDVREKLVLRGAGLLSTAELLSLIIGPDSAGESALPQNDSSTTTMVRSLRYCVPT